MRFRSNRYEIEFIEAHLVRNAFLSKREFNKGFCGYEQTTNIFHGDWRQDKHRSIHKAVAIESNLPERAISQL
jgi:hypothetical protein